ncbi:hypothetical protein DRN75_00690 [Nanoarchaeota archaeon]|nr:MAG: hypothetical protein DRN75_00690 [Nanoarchaeota archaeon]
MKGQGLPLNFIVLGALALLVLVVVIAYFVTGGASIFQQTSDTQVQQQCNSLCANIQTVYAQQYSYNGIRGDIEGSAAAYCEQNKIYQKEKNVDCQRVRGPCIVQTMDGNQYRITCSNGQPHAEEITQQQTQ